MRVGGTHYHNTSTRFPSPLLIPSPPLCGSEPDIPRRPRCATPTPAETLQAAADLRQATLSLRQDLQGGERDPNTSTNTLPPQCHCQARPCPARREAGPGVASSTAARSPEAARGGGSLPASLPASAARTLTPSSPLPPLSPPPCSEASEVLVAGGEGRGGGGAGRAGRKAPRAAQRRPLTGRDGQPGLSARRGKAPGRRRLPALAHAR